MAIIVALGACSRGPSAGIDLPGDLVGCYELRRTSDLYYAPPRLRLTADTLTRWDRRFVADSTSTAWMLRRLDAGGRPAEGHFHEIVYWQRDSGSGRLRVMISTGHSGTEMLLDVFASSDTLTGSATEHDDVDPPTTGPGAPVLLIRVACLSHASPRITR